MCRLLYLNNKAIKSIPEKKLITLLNYLEKSNGGHGNGIGGLLQNNMWYIYKGLDADNEILAKKIKRNKWKNGVIYHTRLASSGSITSKLNHPFLSLDRDVLLAHNGHIYSAREYLSFLKKLFPEKYEKYEYSYAYYYKGYYYYYVKNGKENVSDTWIATEILSFLKKTYDHDLLMKKFKNFLGNGGNFFVQLSDGTIYLVIGGRDFEFYAKDGVIIGASEGISRILGLQPTFTMSHGIIGIRNGRYWIVMGELTPYKEKFRCYKATKKEEKKEAKEETQHVNNVFYGLTDEEKKALEELERQYWDYWDY